MSHSDGDVIAVHGLTVTYDGALRPTGLCVFRNFEFAIRRGEFVWLVGRNGVGKTTLLRVLAGTLRPTAGTVSLFGRGSADARGSFVFQDPAASLLPWMTARRNIELPMQWSSIPPSDRARHVDSILDTLGIDFNVALYPYQLSGGQQQLVSLARALVQKPDILLLDEPFTQLDAAHRLRLKAILAGPLRAMGLTTVMIAHEFDLSAELATRCVLLNGRPASVRLDEQMEGATRSAVLSQVSRLIMDSSRM